MVELSDSFKQLDTVGKLRYEEKLGMLGVTTDPYSTSRHVWPAHKVEAYHKGCVNHDSGNSNAAKKFGRHYCNTIATSTSSC